MRERRRFCGAALLVAAAVLLMLSSCSSSDARILDVSTCLVFDYDGTESEPSMRLSLFIQTDGDARRTQSVKAVHVQSGSTWLCRDVQMIMTKEKKDWAGYTHLLPPTGEAFPSGKYIVYYTDSAGNESESQCIIDYPDYIQSLDVDSIPLSLKGEYIKMVAVYDDDGTVIYYGNYSSEWDDLSVMRRDFAQGSTFRVCYAMNAMSVVLMMREQNLHDVQSAE